MKIINIVGARPQFIKVAPVTEALNEVLGRKATVKMIHTGQHYNGNMSQIFFDELKIPKPNWNLRIGSGTHGEQTGKMLIEIEKALLEEKPDGAVVYGDTNSTVAGSLAAAKLHILSFHVEAGLRSFNREMPEEINRILTDHASSVLFCPTKDAVNNLKREGITKRGKVYLTGDVMKDALVKNSKIARKKSAIIKDLNLKRKKFLLATVHRAENTDTKRNLENIFNTFMDLKEKVVVPLHPRTRKYLEQYGLLKKILESLMVEIIKPVGYLEMLELERNARLILTDSGGIQKEAYLLKTPCITLREETEWVETVKAGWNKLVGADPKKIYSAARNFKPRKEREYIFGRGSASRKIAKIIEKMVC
ncbi:UDP-N-acetylglucosamine 2-epimerase (non-hydrolyzing) [bacterium (Candidatus Torokbacteria) CG_4_10_14_0_2_um_filter_35_8]|nr:MAG: UDP-N-acetylglucosamine 2-epimerase (non-hydrolyzing) [bacterium (Candidatus Torokbacteria) CG_4_10_14_0_2_um_filter_35_8]